MLVYISSFLGLLLLSAIPAHGKVVVVRRPRKEKHSNILHYTNNYTKEELHKLEDKSQGNLPHIHNETKANISTVMVCAIVRDEEAYIDEWIQYHQLLGINLMHLFDNSLNGSAKMAYLPQRYGTMIRVTHVPGDSSQSRVYNHCVKKYSLGAIWAAFIDIDEFIVLRNHTIIHLFLQDVAPYGGAVTIRRYTFGSNGELNYKNQPVLTRFTARSVEPEKGNKYIAYLPDVQRVEPHRCQLKHGKHTVSSNGQRIAPAADTARKGNMNVKVEETTEEPAMINHYYTKSLEEFRGKRHRYRYRYRYSSASPHERLGTSKSSPNAAHESPAAAKSDKDSADLMEFIKSDSRANAMQDTFARDFFQRSTAAGNVTKL